MFNFNKVNEYITSKFLVNLQSLKLAKEAVDSIESALICEPQNLQGFIVKCKKYDWKIKKVIVIKYQNNDQNLFVNGVTFYFITD